MRVAETFITETGGTQSQAYRESESMSKEREKELREAVGFTEAQLNDIRKGLEVL